jgi:hypothetical protein
MGLRRQLQLWLACFRNQSEQAVDNRYPCPWLVATPFRRHREATECPCGAVIDTAAQSRGAWYREGPRRSERAHAGGGAPRSVPPKGFSTRRTRVRIRAVAPSLSSAIIQVWLGVLSHRSKQCRRKLSSPLVALPTARVSPSRYIGGQRRSRILREFIICVRVIRSKPVQVGE